MDVADFLSRVEGVASNSFSFIKLVMNVERKLYSAAGVKHRPPGFYEILDYSDVYAVGDLHGDLDTLVEFIEVSGVLSEMENNSGTKLLFLGDYVDRGPRQVEVLAAVLLLKDLYPDSVILLRGNHEPPPLLMPIPRDLYEHIHLKFGENSDLVYSFVMSLFQKLAYGARVPNKALFLHGGPPSTVIEAKSFEEAFSVGRPCADDGVLEDVLWSDPIEYSENPVEESPRGAGYLFGEAVTRKTLELARVRFIVRGHEAVNGYKVNHGGRVLTLFDTKAEPYYLGRAAYLHFSRSDELENVLKYVRVF